MAKKKGPTIKKGLDEWMATYSDMVTLLFCFFVLLYATSSTDETKLQYVLSAFRTDGKFINTVVTRPSEHLRNPDDGNAEFPMDTIGDNIANPPGQTSNPFVFDSLAAALSDLIEENELQDAVQISATPGRIRIRLGSDIMFDGNSYQLRPQGLHVLDLLAPSISAVEFTIGDVQVQGHTADIGAPNSGANDWELSSMRAVTVVNYLDGIHRMVDSEKFKAEGFGQHEPVASNDTAEGRAENRRVEIIINRRIDITPEEHRLATDIAAFDYGNPLWEVDAEGGRIEAPGTPIDSIVDSIIGDLNDRYGDTPQGPGIIGGLTPDSGAVGPGVGGFRDVHDDDYAVLEEENSGAGDTPAEE